MMVNNPISNTDTPEIEELKTKISKLQQKIDEANAINQSMWALLVEISRRLQVSSAAIKASVSSLLGYDIFFDGSTQHELLEIIDDSTDQVSAQITLLSLAFRSESQSLKIKPEPNELQEILSYVLDTIDNEYPDLELTLDMASDSLPALVDYEYLSVALNLLLEVLAETHKAPQEFEVVASIVKNLWHIEIFGVNDEILEFLGSISLCIADELTQDLRLSPTHKLKLLVMCRIFGLQSIQIGTSIKEENHGCIRLSIPLVETSDDS